MTKHILDTIDPVVIGERLTDARRARRMTQHDAAASLGVARTTIVAMEKGIRRPRAAELLHLAQLYGRQVSDFVRPQPRPVTDGFVIQFRSAAGPSTAVPDAEREADSRRFERLCRSYVELEALLGTPLPRRPPPTYDTSGAPPDAAGQEVAAAERNRLNLGDSPLHDPWGVLETDAGLRIFVFPFQSRQIAGMFVYTDELGGCIAVNANHPEDKRRMTLAHDYWHFLTDRFRPDIALVGGQRRLRDRERAAEAFARNFLLPATGLTLRFQTIRRAKDGIVTPADLLGLTALYGVSVQALTWRLEELELVPFGTWDALKDRGFQPRKARAIAGIPELEPARSVLPLRYELLAIQAYEQDLLSMDELARYLDTDVIGARQRVEDLTGTRYFEDGDLRQLSLDLTSPLIASHP